MFSTFTGKHLTHSFTHALHNAFNYNVSSDLKSSTIEAHSRDLKPTLHNFLYTASSKGLEQSRDTDFPRKWCLLTEA